jgi:hypothetical protein
MPLLTGPQLIDSAFDAHFDLSRLMRLSELQISLPQPDDRWGASTAQNWASFPSMLGKFSASFSSFEEILIV